MPIFHEHRDRPPTTAWQVAAVVDAEMARFQREKLADFKQMVVNFVTIQLECSQRIQATWQGLLPQLEAIEPPPPGPPPI